MWQVPAKKFHHILALLDYVSYSIPKKSGGIRAVEAPQGLLRELQGRLAKYMQPFYTQHKLPCVHGFVKAFNNEPKYGVLTNAKPHLNKPCVLNMDIKNFFDSISAKHVKQALQQYPFMVSDEVTISCEVELINLGSTHMQMKMDETTSSVPKAADILN